MRKIVEWRVSYHYAQRTPAASFHQEVQYTTLGGYVWRTDTVFRDMENRLLEQLQADLSIDPAVRNWVSLPVGTWRFA